MPIQDLLDEIEISNINFNIKDLLQNIKKTISEDRK